MVRRVVTFGLSLLMVGGSVTARAQEATASLDELVASSQLRPSDDVFVTDSAGHRIRGRIETVSPEAVVLEKRGRLETLDRATIARIERRDSLENGIWIGLAVGIGGLYISAFALCPGDPECGAYAVEYVGLPMVLAGVGIGAAVDAAHRRTLYSNPAITRRQISLVPFVAPGHAGLALSTRF